MNGITDEPSEGKENKAALDINRRSFLKLMAAPLALAGLSACLPQPEERILPYTNAPEELLPGKPLFYATAMEMDGYGQGLLVESNYGRPTKVEGNPDHPASLGATDAFAQASVLTLFDPDRAQVVTSGGQIRTWESFSAILDAAMQSQQGSGGAGLRILSGTVTSPTLASQVQALLQQFPNAVWYQYDPVGRDNVRQGSSLAFGQPVETHYRFERANLILSLDDNLVLREPGRLRYLRDFASRRQSPEGSGGMNRLYVIESTFSTLGGFADHRLAVQASQVEIFTRALAARLGIRTAGEFQVPGNWGEWLDALAEDLQANQGASLVLVGPQQPPVVHALGHAINAALGNTGQTVFYTDPVEAFPVDQTANLVELARDLQAGRVELLVVLDGNPVYTAPADLDFSEAFQKAGLSIYLGLYEDETADLASWQIPAAHFLEMWSDTRAFDGTATIIQPLIEPLYGGKSPHELIAALLGQTDASGYDIVRAFWQDRMEMTGAAPAESTPSAGGTPAATGEASPSSAAITPAPPAASRGAGTPRPAGGAAPGGVPGTPATTETAGGTAGQANQPGGPTSNPAGAAFERIWSQALRTGMVPNTALPERQVTLQANFEAPARQNPDNPDSLEILFEPDPSIWDGRFSSNAWLQELPKPVTKLTWDNAALVSPGTADRLGLNNEDVVELRYQGRVVEAPVWILPGQPDGTVTVHLGYGKRTGASEVVNQEFNSSGFNAYALRTSDAPWFGSGLEIQKTGRRYPLANTQQHFNMEGRDLAKAATLEEFGQNPHFAQETEHLPGEGEGHPPSFYPEFEYNGHAWGMAINLGSCIGCNACVVACQAENNIPVVGKDQVQNSREMHWLRIDTYFVGDLENPESRFQPLLCMHCEKAPCEPVCPVEATVHSSEGLNEMVYNRCVGTRYCSNNCPYKVRRFNFLQFTNDDSIPLKMLHNPDVTVRSRGVMEKCTYCVQRINAGRVEAETSGQPLQDGEVVTACQQACPTRAIVFGDLNDPNSAVSQLKAKPLNYDLLAELGTQPRTSYLAKLKNPNPRLSA